MASRKGGRGAQVRDLTLQVLIDIRGEITGLRAEMNGLRGEITNVREELVKLREEHGARLDRLERETARGFEGVSARLDHLVEFSGERWRDHEGRLRRIEERLKIA